ncbi:hypothetical protein [Immundisolibacter sp.]|uniref:hypothetical protein n=1 Tax=Immundisolibacter sp. TaxID=1934948 RepID=UPI003569A901
MPTRPLPGVEHSRPARGLMLAGVAVVALGAHADVVAASWSSPALSLHGFGTLGVVRSDQDDADVVSNTYLQPNGAGHTRRWDFGVDSKLGGQLNADFGDGWSAVVQVVTKHRYDNSWTPEIEWANVKYQLTPGLSLRGGRTVSPIFMLSDTANVGYANPWVRGPQELYGMVPITNLDGIDLAWNTDIGQATNVFQASFGSNTFDAVDGLRIAGKNSWILSNTLEYSFVAVRVGYLRVDLTFDGNDLDPLTDGLAGLGDSLATAGFPVAGQRAMALARRYDIDDTPFEIFSAGLRLTPGNWLLLAEWARGSDAGLIPKTHAGYVTVGYRLRQLQPYVTFAKLDSQTHAPQAIPTGGLPAPQATAADAANSGLAAALQTAAPSQQSLALGLRWDALNAVAVKFEYQHVDLESDSTGRFGNVQPAFQPGGDADLFSVTVDFVF